MAQRSKKHLQNQRSGPPNSVFFPLKVWGFKAQGTPTFQMAPPKFLLKEGANR
jgi:hypothetical protein